MITHPLYIALAPLLVAQGIYVRRVTPRLAEAAGPRKASVGEGSTLKLMILGDSAAAGVGVKTQSEALAGQLLERLRKQFKVSWQLLAKNGKTSRELRKEMMHFPEQSIDWVVISIGVNDVTGMTSRQAWRSNLVAIAHALKQRLDNPKIIWTSLPPMHRFPALPQPLRYCLGLRAKQLNQDLVEITTPLENNFVLTIDPPIEDDFIADDGFHPSAKTYQLWAEAVYSLIAINLD
jgi:lysophospholipase L1-like esterase